jgi:type III secretory pathway component EscS
MEGDCYNGLLRKYPITIDFLELFMYNSSKYSKSDRRQINMKWTIVSRSENGLIVSDGASRYDVPLDSKYIAKLDAVWVDNNCIGKSFNCDTSNAKEALDVQAGAQKFFIMMTVAVTAIIIVFIVGVIAALYFAITFLLAGNFFAVIKIVGALVVVLAVIGFFFGGRREDYGPRNNS